MANKMLIDATHPEETRVVVVRGNRVEEFDYESASRKQLRGNIYLAKVTRVEPSLQAAFIEYGGNRHGFLAFSEIHPDYYQIPVADRLALIEEEERAARLAEDEAELRDRRRERSRARRASPGESVSGEAEPAGEGESSPFAETEAPDEATPAVAETAFAQWPETAQAPEAKAEPAEQAEAAPDTALHGTPFHDAPAQIAEASEEASKAVEPEAPAHAEPHTQAEAPSLPAEAAPASESAVPVGEAASALPLPAEQVSRPVPSDEEIRAEEAAEGEVQPYPVIEASAEAETEAREAGPSEDDEDEEDGGNVEVIEEDDDEDEEGDDEDEEEVIENLGADEDALEEVPERAPQRRARTYKIQEVIRRRQVMLVQVVKEERGNKGAALTTYLSLAGRYSVLMPNTARGGGISRKITNAVDRKRLKEVVQDLEVPEGMGIILRTAGANRNKLEIKRDFEYLLRLWETVRELTLSSAAPSLVYEEGSLIKRAIRDLYNKDIDEVLVAGEDGYREAKDFMRMLMPSHGKNVIAYREPQPIYARYGIEHQLDAMFSPVVQLKSGGYIVINPTEALVSIDVNSGRATREHHIEDTALKTNLEAAEEIARQLRLRDLAGLIVVDFIDMEEKRNNRSVERKLKDCLKNDRARIQIGRISHFGLLEMSRQRIRTGVLESSIEVCPHCGGTGHVRSAASVSLQLLRALEEHLLRSATHNLVARTRSEVALYVLNHKRAHLRELEERFSVTLMVVADDEVTGHQPFLIEKGDLAAPPAPAPRPSTVIHPDSILPDEDYEEELEDEEAAEGDGDGEGTAETSAEGEGAEGDGNRKRRRRRRRRRSGESEGETEGAEPIGAEAEEADDEERAEAEDGEEDEGEARADEESAERRRRRRGRRGGRRNRRDREDGEKTPLGEDAEDLIASEGESVAEAELGEHGERPVAARAPEASEATPAAEVPLSPVETAPIARSEAPNTAPRTVTAEEPAPAVQPSHSDGPAAEAASPAPRRRSTVREKAPVVLSEDGGVSIAPAAETAVQVDTVAETAPAEEIPVAEPATPAPASEVPATDQKPRSGWWQRKLFGG